MESNKSKGASVVLFSPDGVRNLKDYHPELAKYSEFKTLTGIEMKFVWCYAILYRDITDHKARVLKSIYDSYGTLCDFDTQKLCRGEFSRKIKTAIDKMGAFDPSPRLKARYITERIFAAYNTIIEIDVKEAFTVKTKTKDGDCVNEEMDWGKLSQFVTATKNISLALPDMIQKLEEGFGFGRNKESVKEDESGLAEEFMNGA